MVRLSPTTWGVIKQFLAAQARVRFYYNGRERVGTIDTIGEGPQGPFLTVRLDTGEFKSFSIERISHFQILGK